MELKKVSLGYLSDGGRRRRRRRSKGTRRKPRRLLLDLRWFLRHRRRHRRHRRPLTLPNLKIPGPGGRLAGGCPLPLLPLSLGPDTGLALLLRGWPPEKGGGHRGGRRCVLPVMPAPPLLLRRSDSLRRGLGPLRGPKDSPRRLPLLPLPGLHLPDRRSCDDVVYYSSHPARPRRRPLSLLLSARLLFPQYLMMDFMKSPRVLPLQMGRTSVFHLFF